MSDLVGKPKAGLVVTRLTKYRVPIYSITNGFKTLSNNIRRIDMKVIMITGPCIVYPPYTPFYIVKFGLTGVYIFFLF